MQLPPPWDAAAWAARADDALAAPPDADGAVSADARAVLDALLDLYPSSARHWHDAIQRALDLRDTALAELLFSRVLPVLPAPPLWTLYLEYLDHKAPSLDDADVDPAAAAAATDASLAAVQTHRDALTMAYEKACAAVGLDPAAGPIWQAYVQHAAHAPAHSAWEEHKRNDHLRSIYRRAVVLPSAMTEALWKEYDAFENAVHAANARRVLGQVSGAYMSARVAAKDIKALVEAAVHASTQMRAYPGMVRPPGADALDALALHVVPGLGVYSAQDRAALRAWKRVVAWELADPLKLRDTDAAAWVERVTYAHKLACTHGRFLTELWFDAAKFARDHPPPTPEASVDAVGWDASAAGILRRACQALPGSVVLHIALAQTEEAEKRADAAKAALERVIAAITEQHMARVTAYYDEQLAQLDAAVSAAATATATAEPGDDDDGDLRERRREADRVHQARRQRLLEHQRQALARLSRLVTLPWIHLMWTARRTEGINAARKVFGRARRAGTCTYHVYVASALMEYHGSKNAAVAVKVFEAGLKDHGHSGGYVLQYLRFLIHINDDANMRALFERTVSTLAPDDARGVWRAFVEYEAANSDVSAMDAVAARLAAVYPHEPPVDIFALCTGFLDLQPLHFDELASRAGRPAARGERAPPEASDASDDDVLDLAGDAHGLAPSARPGGRLDLSVAASKAYPQPQWSDWAVFKVEEAPPPPDASSSALPEDLAALLPVGLRVPDATLRLLARLPRPARYKGPRLVAEALLEALLAARGLGPSVPPPPLPRAPLPLQPAAFAGGGVDRRRDFDAGPGSYGLPPPRPYKRMLL